MTAGPDSGGPYTPLYEAQNSARYDRQALIRAYEGEYACSLVAVVGPIFPPSVGFFEELLFGIDPSRDLHVMLATPGGDGETALRLIRAAQSRCRVLKVVIPDQAKSAGTLFALGAHKLIMGPTSDLGPVDPQFQLEGQPGFVAAKDIIGAVERATTQIQNAPETYPLWASMLSNVTAIMVQQAQSAIDRTGALLREALASNPDRSPQDIETLVSKLTEKLITEPSSHAAVIGADDALAVGLPVEKLDPASAQWQDLWRLWTRYVTLGPNMIIYEGARASQVFPLS